jgi:SAM-dependent methyltransferase
VRAPICRRTAVWKRRPPRSSRAAMTRSSTPGERGGSRSANPAHLKALWLGSRVASRVGLSFPAKLEAILDPRRFSLPLNLLVCQRTPIYEKWGYAGRGIESFPPYGFFKLCLVDRDGGVDAFKQWYRQRFIVDREWLVPSSDGGLKGSSLHKLVMELHRKAGVPLAADDPSFDPTLVEQSIERRVLHYVGVLESIRREGYRYGRGLIRCVRSAYGDLEIREGHHRVAAARALSFTKLVGLILPDPLTASRASTDARSLANPDPVAFTSPPETWNDAQLKDWIARQRWYQSIPIRNGIVTPGSVDSVTRLRDLDLPSLAGKSVLDVGCNAGMYSFECERLGASRVVGVDIEEYSLRQASILKRVIGSRVEFRRMPLDRVRELGTFDVVLCIAVLHEVPDILTALHTLKAMAKELLYLEVSLWKPIVGGRRPRARLVRNRRGWTMLPTRGLIEAIFSDTFAVTHLGRSARYDLFRIESRHGARADAMGATS